MKSLFSAFIAAASLAASASAQETSPLVRPEPLAEVMLIGTWHFDNPGLDQFNVEADDVLTETRQAEIATVVDRLAEWEPDLVMVEMERGRQDRLDAMHAEYREGGLRDDRNEIVQLGLRLAGRMGHERVAAIDVQHRFRSEEQAQIAADPGERYAAMDMQLQDYGEAAMARTADLLDAETIGGALAAYNSPEWLQANHDFYMRFNIRMWQGDNAGGAHTVANWYTRNLLIFQNILREVEESEGRARRVVVIYGQGHVPTLARFIEDTPLLTLADPLPYLADPE